MDSKIAQFCNRVLTDDKGLATYYLEVSDNNLDVAVQNYLEDKSFQSIVVDSFEDPDKKSEKNIESKSSITILEWNIQGLLEDCLNERTMSVINEIKNRKPDVVFLQEVIPDTAQLIRQKCIGYDAHLPRNASQYYAMMLTLNSSLCVDKKTTVAFKNTQQGRNVVVVEAKHGDIPVVLLCSHLESMKPATMERVEQLVQVADLMLNYSSDALVVFGADTNLRDFEYRQCLTANKGLGDKVVDVWEEIGKPQECRYTWDLQENDNQIKGGNARLRFERVYTRSKSSSSSCLFRPKSIDLIGKHRLECGMFPSDHWGMLTTFSK